MRVVIKIGTSSLTDVHGVLQTEVIDRIAEQVGAIKERGHEPIIVTSGAVAAGLPALGWSADQRPEDPRTLQAISAIGQIHLVQYWSEALARYGVVSGQVLISPYDFANRTQYLHARSTIERLLELDVVPVMNENDALADDEIRFGDNDRISALVANLIRADKLLLLTDTPGLMNADPRIDANATIIEEISLIDDEVEQLAGSAGTARGSGGMASKLQAAKMASWSGIPTVIAQANRPHVIPDALTGTPGVGTIIAARSARLSARKLWIAFATSTVGTIHIDQGAVNAIARHGRSLLAAGVTGVDGTFGADATVEVRGPQNVVVAKGIVKATSERIRSVAGKRSSDLILEESGLVIHRDDLVTLVN